MARTDSTAIQLKTAHEIEFSPSEDRIAVVGKRDISAMDLNTRKAAFAVRSVANPSHIDFSPDGRRLVVKSTSGRTIIIDGETGRTLKDFRNRSEGEGSAALFSSCGRYIASVSWNGLFTVRDGTTGKLVISRRHDGSMLDHLSAPADRSFFVYSVSRPASSRSQPRPPQQVMVRKWPVRGEEGTELPKSWSFIGALAVSPSGRFLAVIHRMRTLEIYDLVKSKEVSLRSVHVGGTDSSIGWSPDERMLVVNEDDLFSVFEMPKLKLKQRIPMEYACFARFSPSSRWLALGSWRESFVVPTESLAAFVQERRANA